MTAPLNAPGDTAQRIHLTDVPPPYCSGCFGHPETRYVDFGAVHEGPSFAAGEDAPVVGGGPLTSDQLVLCEQCVKTAAGLVGFGDVEQLQRQLEDAAADRERMSDRLAAQAAHIDQLEGTVATREGLRSAMGEPEAPPAKPRSRGKTRAAA